MVVVGVVGVVQVEVRKVVVVGVVMVRVLVRMMVGRVDMRDVLVGVMDGVVVVSVGAHRREKT